MRYPDCGGVSARERVQREQVRLAAAGMFEHDVAAMEIAARLRVSTKSVYQWRRRWTGEGRAGLGSHGPGGMTCHLSGEQLQRLTAELDRGPAVHGWAGDQRWTLARVAELIERLFGVVYTPRGVGYLLHRIGYTVQVPKQRAVERNEDAVAAWRTTTWAKVRG
jgi:putative transposase